MPEIRAMIFANGLIPDLEAARVLLQPDDLLIAADGGARHLTALGCTPHVVIGDLDSLSPAEVQQLAEAGARILRYTVEKDETDLELAILYACDQGCTHLRIVGGMGGRLDHTLANLFLLALPALDGLDARLDDGTEEVFLIRGSAAVAGQRGDVVSLLPLGGAAHGVATQGLRYPLNGETLFPERSRGVSNEMIDGEAQVRLDGGTLICIHTRKKDIPHVE
jgi:thiamine pyrophosphokinase